MAIVEDYTDLKKTEEALKESEKRYRQLFQSAPIAMIEWDASLLKAYLEELRSSGVSDFSAYLSQHPRQVHHCWSLIKAVDHNQAFLELMGVTGREGYGGAFIPTDAPGFLKMAREIILVAAGGNTTVEREETLVTTTGEPKIVLGKSLVISGHEDTLSRVAIALVDISKRKKAEAALRESERRFREQALRDGLTGLYNQRYLYQSLSGWIERAQTTDTPISLVFMDLDHFKKIVDTHGHLNGSRAIQKVAGTIDNCLEDPAYAVAYAGDEFVVVLPGLNQPQAMQKASEIRSQVKNMVYELEPGLAVRLTASFGVATFPHDATDLNGLIAAADHALFAIKEAGKDSVGGFQQR
jgi:diguanylate cyclase (GGDEF)-like protein